MLELIGLLLNAGIFFVASYVLVRDAYGPRGVAVVTLGLTAFYAAHVYYFLVRRIADRELLLSFMGLSVFFVAVTIPLLLSREWITVSWAIQALVMLWLADKLNSQFLRQVAFLLYGIVLFRFGLMDLPAQYSSALPRSGDVALGEYLLHLLERLVVFGVPIGSMAGAYFLLKAPQASGRLARRPGQRRGPVGANAVGRPVLDHRRSGDGVPVPSPRAQPHAQLSFRSLPPAGAHAALAGDVPVLAPRISCQPEPAGPGFSGALRRGSSGQARILRPAVLAVRRGALCMVAAIRSWTP